MAVNNHRNNNTLLVGAAVAVGLVGTLASLFWPKRRGWTGQARGMAHQLKRGVRSWTRADAMTKNFVLGGVAGSVVGASTALLFAPKSGKDLVKDLSKPFQFNSFEVSKTTHPKRAKPARTAKKAATKVARHVATSQPKSIARKKSSSASHYSDYRSDHSSQSKKRASRSKFRAPKKHHD